MNKQRIIEQLKLTFLSNKELFNSWSLYINLKGEIILHKTF